MLTRSFRPQSAKCVPVAHKFTTSCITGSASSRFDIHLRTDIPSSTLAQGFTTCQKVRKKLEDVVKTFPQIKTVGKSVKEQREIRRQIEERQRAEADRCAYELDKKGEVVKVSCGDV